MSAFDFAILGAVFVGSLWVLVSILDDIVHRRRLHREGEKLAEVFYLDGTTEFDPCVNCAHPRQAHTILARGRRRGACQVSECVCPAYTPDRQEMAQ